MQSIGRPPCGAGRGERRAEATREVRGPASSGSVCSVERGLDFISLQGGTTQRF